MDLNKMIEQTNIEMKKAHNIITEASFKYNNNFCSVDILKNDKDGVEVYEVKSSTKISQIYLSDIAYQVYVLKHLGLNVKKACIVYINSNYERKGELDLKQLFKISNVTPIAEEKQEEIDQKIKEIKEYVTKKQEPEEPIGMQCFTPYDCPYWNYCTKDLPQNNVFTLSTMQKKKKFELYNKDIYKFEDLINSNINEKYKIQIDYEINKKKPKIEVEKIKKFMKKLYYPLYFLDFETFQQAIPKYDGIRPYMQIPFQYSLHYIEKEGGKLEHKEFLAQAGKDPRKELAEQLVYDIPTNACVLAYNMGFEKGVIEKLSIKYPTLRKNLMKIHDNIQDLMNPFRKKDYYCRAMQGSYSIKYVLPALFPSDPELDYHNLPMVHNGTEAMNTFAQMEFMSKEEQEKFRTGLLVYCQLDTYAMVKIWEKLNEILKDT